MNSQQQQDAVRASITETISELDGLREKARKGWTEYSAIIWDEVSQEEQKYFERLIEFGPLLIAHAKAGHELYETVLGLYVDTYTYQDLISGNIDGAKVDKEWVEKRDAAISAYRSATALHLIGPT